MRYLLLILLTSLGLAGQAQNITPIGSHTQVIENKGSYKADRLQILPRSFTPFSSFDSTASIWFDSAGTKALWYHNGTARVQIGSGGGDSSLFSTIYRNDTGNRNIRASLANYLPLTGGLMMGGVNFNGFPVTGLTPPINPTDAVSFEFLTEFINGLQWKDPVTIATITDLPAYSFDGIDQLVVNANGACPTIDGKTLRLNERLLYKDAVGDDSIFNGLYLVSQLGGTGIQCIFKRTSDANTALLLEHATVIVDSGTINGGKAFTQVKTGITINVTPIAFVPILNSVINAGRGLGISNNTFYVDSTVVLYIHDSATASIQPSKYVTPYRLSQAIAGITLHPTLDTVLRYGSITAREADFASNAGTSTIAPNDIEVGTPTGYDGLLGMQMGYDNSANKYYPHLFGMDSTTYRFMIHVLRLTADRTYSLPDKSGTFAMTSDLNSYYLASNPNGYTSNLGTVTSVAASGGTGISVSGSPITSAGTFTITNTAPDQTVSIANGYAITPSGTYPNFTLTADTLKLSTRAYRQKGLDSVVALFNGSGYITGATLIRVDTYFTAGTFTVTPAAGSKVMTIEAVAGGGGAGSCFINSGTSTIAVTGGGGAGGQFKASQINFVWSSAVLTIGAAGSAGTIGSCSPTCSVTATSGGNGGNTTFTDGTNTYTAFGGVGTSTVTGSSSAKIAPGGSPPAASTGANEVNLSGSIGSYGWMASTTIFASGGGANAPGWGIGGEPIYVANTTGNNGTGNGSGGSGCVSNAATGLGNSKSGGAGRPGGAIIRWYK